MIDYVHSCLFCIVIFFFSLFVYGNNFSENGSNVLIFLDTIRTNEIQTLKFQTISTVFVLNIEL